MVLQQAMEGPHATRRDVFYHPIFHFHSTLPATLVTNYRDELGTSATLPRAASALKLGHTSDGMPCRVQTIKE